MSTVNLEKVIKSNIKRVTDDSASYVDVRFYMDDNSETLAFYDGNLERNNTRFESGVGIRILFGGAWGFAATSNTAEIDACFDQAFINAKTAAELVQTPLSMGKSEGYKGEYSSPVDIDPFSVSLREKLDVMEKMDEALKEEWIVKRMVSASFQKKQILFFNSNGVETEKNLTHVFAHMNIMAFDTDNQLQRRSKVLHTTGKDTCGWEMVLQPELFSGHAERIKEELSLLIKADPLEYGKRSVILLPGQGHLQVHETIGHPLELDRILGYELSFAGGTFVTLDSIGKLRYGSEKLSVSSYGGVENSPGTFGYDDDGSPERDYLLIDKGILVNALTSRAMINEAHEKAGKEIFSDIGGVARACAFYRAPIDRMTNINILPGNDGNLEDIVSSTEDGVIMDNPVSWSIGSNREHFHFGCEIAWEVKDGKKTRVLKNPTYQGHTLEFYNSISAVGDESTWTLEQVDNCGKGEPNQIMQVGHGVPVVRYDNVVTGERGLS